MSRLLHWVQAAYPGSSVRGWVQGVNATRIGESMTVHQLAGGVTNARTPDRRSEADGVPSMGPWTVPPPDWTEGWVQWDGGVGGAPGSPEDPGTRRQVGSPSLSLFVSTISRDICPLCGEFPHSRPSQRGFLTRITALGTGFMGLDAGVSVQSEPRTGSGLPRKPMAA
jgi:hypothetical protein